MRAFVTLWLVLLAALPAWAADPSWTGQWDTRWRDGGARMELLQRGNQITGAYPAYGGTITGAVEGRELHGQWHEGPRSGAITFVLAPDGQSFMGRFDTGEWWTGGRVQADGKGVVIDQAGARQALRTFVMAGNAARSGNLNEWAKAAAVMEFGEAGASMAPGQKLATARALFELVDQTTFQLFAIPGRRATGERLDVELKQAGTGVVLPLALVRGTDNLWRVAMPQGELGKLRDSLLARSGGRLPPPDDLKRRATARDAMRSFAAGFADWDGSGRQQVLDTLDLSGFSDATRAYEGELAAAYLNEAMDRIGQVVPQEIPDDPQSRLPYTVFSHPAGAMVLTPASSASGNEAVGWRFSADTVRSARELYTAIEDMPEVEGGTLPDVPSSYMRLRRWVRDVSPSLFTRVGPVEAWQGLGVLALLTASFAVAFAVGWFVLAILRWAVGGRQVMAEREFRWPLRLALAFLLYHFAVDRPFRRGDWIEAGEAKGTVEHVGIRSTRIRTGDDSLLVVPNGKLADATVNNLGTRRHRVFKAKLLVGHDTLATALAAFMDGLVALTTSLPHVRPGSAKVGVTSIGPDGVEVELTCCLDVRTTDDERADRTALMLEVLRLVDWMRIRLGDQAPVATPALGVVAA